MGNFIYHVKTKNMSFLETYLELKDLDVKNNSFFLKLYDPELQDVNPHTPHLSDEEKMRIMNECEKNVWYFLRECVRIQIPGGTDQFELHRGNATTVECFLRGYDQYVQQPRHTYTRGTLICLAVWLLLFGGKNTEIGFMDIDFNNCLLVADRIRDIVSLLPKFMRFPIHEKNLENKFELFTMGNKIRFRYAPKQMDAVEKMARGMTEPIHFFNNVELIPFFKHIWNESLPVRNRAKNNAKNKGGLFGCVVTSPIVSDSINTPFINDMIDNTCHWDLGLYDMETDKIYQYLFNNSPSDMFLNKHKYPQLRKDEKWFDLQCLAMLNDKNRIRREILLERY